MADDDEVNPVVPDVGGVPQDDDAEPDDAEVTHQATPVEVSEQTDVV